RAFNRFYTRVIGVLADGLLHTPYSLTEARVIFELAHREDAEVAVLRRDLGLDAGYLSRMLARFESDGLVTRTTAAHDGRRRIVRLTAAGRAVFDTLDARSAADVDALLAPIDVAGQRRLVAAMADITRVLGPARTPALSIREPGPGDLGW